MSSPAMRNGSSGNGGHTSQMWRFLVDENLPQRLTRQLRAAGYVVDDVREVGLRTRPDPEVWAYAQAHQETVISEDKDFANPNHYPVPHAGVVISDLPDRLPIALQVQIIVDGIASLSVPSLANIVITISPGRVRVRK